MERRVSLLVLLKLVTGKKPFGLLGLLFTAVSVFILFPVTLFVSATFKEAYENYNYDEIIEKGTDVKAVVIAVEPMTNVSVNGSNPNRITFQYTDNNRVLTDKFQTFDLDKTANLEPGDTIAATTYQGQSVLKGIEPFHFPFGLFLILPTIFFILGSIFLSIALLPSLKIFRLYKRGVVKQGTITSLVVNAGMPATGIGRKVFVDYYYTDSSGTRIYGNGTTTDFSILGEKKVGDAIRIFVMPDDKEATCLLPEREAAKYGWA